MDVTKIGQKSVRAVSPPGSIKLPFCVPDLGEIKLSLSISQCYAEPRMPWSCGICLRRPNSTTADQPTASKY